MPLLDRIASSRAFRAQAANGATRFHRIERARLHVAMHVRASPSVNVIGASRVESRMLMRGTFCDVDGQVSPRLPS
jgi:hypothetical protein